MDDLGLLSRKVPTAGWRTTADDSGGGVVRAPFDPSAPCPAPTWKLFRCELARLLPGGEETAPTEVVLDEAAPLAFVWEAGAVLTQYLQDPSVFPAGALAGRSVADVGAGTGIAAIAAALLGAAPVLATEVPSYLGVLKGNIAACGLQEAVRTQFFAWEETLAATDIDVVTPPFDLVLAADVLFRRDAWPGLARALEVLSGPGSMVLLSFLKRGPELEFLEEPRIRRTFDAERVELQPRWCSRDRIPFRTAGEEANAATVNLYRLTRKR